MLPKGRTALYAVWCACERFNILPPNIEKEWSKCSIEAQSNLIAFNQIRDVETQKEQAALRGLF